MLEYDKVARRIELTVHAVDRGDKRADALLDLRKHLAAQEHLLRSEFLIIVDIDQGDRGHLLLIEAAVVQRLRPVDPVLVGQIMLLASVPALHRQVHDLICAARELDLLRLRRMLDVKPRDQPLNILTLAKGEKRIVAPDDASTLIEYRTGKLHHLGYVDRCKRIRMQHVVHFILQPALEA
ncbi:hypothetical protein SDC9_164429 [bioreactor metagenome]|uniref:Uncharacterized protein n=1 Tax=bioreactor metagenome TaxID=1076179 RepID=A0A645FUA3_9ZZZZ